MFAQEFSGSSDEDTAGVEDGNTGSASSDASGSFDLLAEAPIPSPNPTLVVIPILTPIPLIPTTPTSPSSPTTPLNPNPPEVDIDGLATPLASADGLNSVDHFAYIIGYDDGTVRPENKITQAEFAAIAARFLD